MFVSRYAGTIHRLRWFILALWIVGSVASFMFLPNLTKVVAQKGNSYLPSTAPSVVAANWMKQIDPSSQTPSSTIVAIQNPHGLTKEDTAYFNRILETMNAHKKAYHIATVTAAFNTNKNASSSFKSKDGTTLIAIIGTRHGVGQPANSSAFTAIDNAFVKPPGGAHIYVTGDAKIQQDDMTISQQGVSKSGLVTVILVLVILLLVFRSVVSPIITLLSIGMSFIFTSGIVGWLANLGMPASTFTQTFLIAILFGAGTDYSIIMMMRFREEMMHGHPSRVQALEATLRAVSKTILFSGLTVFLSFAILYFAKFGLYRSAVGVSVGMLVTLVTCLVFIPAMLSLLGPHLFWPRRPKVGESHPPFRFWGWSGGVSIRRPWTVLLILIIVLTPVGLLFTDHRTFDPMTDIPQAPSVKGFHAIAKAFGEGKIMPVDIVLKTDANLRTPQGLTTIQQLTETLSSMPYVTGVDSATEPTGSVITSFQMGNQDLTVSKNLSKVENGLRQLNQGLGSATRQSANGISGVNKLKSGSQQVTSGISKVQQGIGKVASSMNAVAAGAGRVASGVSAFGTSTGKLANGLTALARGTGQLNQGTSQMSQGVGSLTSGANSLASGQKDLQSYASQLANALAAWAKANPAAAAQPSWQQIMALAKGLSAGETKATAGAQNLANGLGALNASSAQLAKASASINQATGKLAAGAKRLAQATPQLVTGTTNLAKGLNSLSAGTQVLATSTGKLAAGSGQVTSGIGKLGSGMQTMINGTARTKSAVSKLQSGVAQINQYLKETGRASTKQNPGFYIPQSTIDHNSQLKQAMNAYISPNGHIAKFSVTMSLNPYSTKALEQVPGLIQAAKTALMSSPVHSGSILATGATATQTDLNSVSSSDFVRTITIVLVAITILLMIMLGSVITPLYIITSLGGTYFVSMGLLQTLVIHVLHKPGLSWVDPFFVFLLLVALGVDYSIFLMSRYEEEIPKASDIASAMLTAMKRMGGVIFSAMFIMAGTFGSLSASGVTSLIEIAAGVVIGLLVYTVIFLAFFVPAAAAVVGGGHFWPFKTGASKRRLPSAMEAIEGE